MKRWDGRGTTDCTKLSGVLFILSLSLFSINALLSFYLAFASRRKRVNHMIPHKPIGSSIARQNKFFCCPAPLCLPLPPFSIRLRSRFYFFSPVYFMLSYLVVFHRCFSLIMSFGFHIFPFCFLDSS
ncbi:hypothetical protein B0J18DRAFT_283360 [Chaetomium sp. MPI-SDFR-AT-0129]|nr:hypothetical protein B0J18DRAFT_283360 [Chaetomium sp. MPI-SDFR-AT-0129]